MNSRHMKETFLRLCAVDSVSATPGERRMPDILKELLLEIPYFSAHPQAVELHPAGPDAADGRFVLALLPAPRPTKRTILLMSHFDVVDVDEYGKAKDLAFSPIDYTDFLQSGAMTLPLEAKTDLDSGNFLFGRGVCDMKWGIAADLELLAYFDAHPKELQANLLFLSVPDEERNSQGMLAAAALLPRWREARELTFLCCIVGEPDISPVKTRAGRALHVGAAGKLMPLFYCVGKETHVGQPFCGLNPHLLTSAILEEMELSAAFIDVQGQCSTPAPTCLKLGDRKDAYSVQTPYAAYAYFNVMTLRRTPGQMLADIRLLAEKAFSRTLARLEEKHAQAQAFLKQPLEKSAFLPKVRSYQELCTLCRQRHGDRFDKHMQRFLQEAPPVDLRELTVRAIEEAHSFCPDRDPVIVLAFAPPYYPHTGFPKGTSIAVKACKALAEEAPEEGYFLDCNFCGLTDMSYLSLGEDVDIPSLCENFPVWGQRYQVPLEEIRALNTPFINFGPLGKDAHRFTERIDLAYSFEKAPGLLLKLVQLLFLL